MTHQLITKLTLLKNGVPLRLGGALVSQQCRYQQKRHTPFLHGSPALGAFAMTERSALIEAVAQEDRDAAQALLWTLGAKNVDGVALDFARHRQAAIASVIAHATSDEAVDRALTAWNVSDSEEMKAAILAALNERQS